MVMQMVKHGRNSPCPCGSGKKYKKCCLVKQAAVSSLNWQKMRKTEGEFIHTLLNHADRFYNPQAISEAWDEFTLWNDVPMDLETQLELDTAFLPWFVFNWIPDNSGIKEDEYYPEMQVAKHYLEHKHSKTDSFQRQFINEICAQPYSFFVITAVEPGVSLALRDLLLGHEFSVLERQASTSLQKGSIIYSRVITMNEDTIMVGCAPTVIPPSFLNEFIDLREDLMPKSHPDYREFLLNYDEELRTVYYDIKEHLFNPTLPELRNTDGDLLQMTKQYYTLKCSPQVALDALLSLSLTKNADEFLHETTFDKQGELLTIEFPWLKKGNKQHVGWNNTVMGHITIDGDKLTIDVNSETRADAIQRKVSRRLGKRAEFRNAVIQSSEKMLEDIANKPANSNANFARQQSEELSAMPEIQEKLQEMAAQHWQEWIDMPLPVLKNQTPRAAAKTEIGRERLEALLVQFEHQSTSPQPFTPDIDALRKTLQLIKYD